MTNSTKSGKVTYCQHRIQYDAVCSSACVQRLKEGLQKFEAPGSGRSGGASGSGGGASGSGGGASGSGASSKYYPPS